MKGKTPHLRKDEIQQAFVTALNILLKDRKKYVKRVKRNIRRSTDKSALEEEQTRLGAEMEALIQENNALIAENAKRGIDREEFDARYDAIVAAYKKNASEIFCTRVHFFVAICNNRCYNPKCFIMQFFIWRSRLWHTESP